MEITKSLEYTQRQLDAEIVTVKNDINKLKTDIKGLEENLLDPFRVRR